MTVQFLVFTLFTLVLTVTSDDAPQRKLHEVHFERFLKEFVALTVDTFNKIGSANDSKIYDVVKLQITTKRLRNSLWTYDRLDLALRETNCTKQDEPELENCVMVGPICQIEPCNESTNRTKALNKVQYFGSSLGKVQEVKFDKYLQDAITMAVNTFNQLGNVKENKLYDVVLIKTTVRRLETDKWMYDRLEMVLRETNCTKIENSISLEGCVVIDDNEPDQSCRYQVSTGQINPNQILGCSDINGRRRR